MCIRDRLKSLVYFAGLASVMRVWRRNYGNSLPMYGFVFLTVVFWLPAYYNFRNLKDGLLSGLFLLCMALLDTLIRPRWQILTPRTKGKTVMGWCLLLGLLWIISTIRLYYAAAIALGFSMHLIGSVQMDAKLRVAVITTAALLAVFVIGGRIGATALKQFEAHKGGGYGIFGIFRGLVTPIPWQYFIKVLIPSHCFYLLMLPFAFFAFFAHFRVNLTWHAYTAAILIIAVGIAMEGSQTRKRMIVVPIFVMWILVRMALKRGIHIMQRREQLLAEQAMFEEFPEQMLDEYDYEEQFLYDHV